MDYLLILLFAMGFMSAAIANILFFWMKARLIEEGVSTREFLFLTDVYRMVKNYRKLGRPKGWSFLPVALFVVATSATFVFVLAFVIRLQVVGTK